MCRPILGSIDDLLIYLTFILIGILWWKIKTIEFL